MKTEIVKDIDLIYQTKTGKTRTKKVDAILKGKDMYIYDKKKVTVLKNFSIADVQWNKNNKIFITFKGK